jgi:hypothetical protein
MPQFARPSTDTTRDNWTEDDGGTTSIYDQIDESSVDDADYIMTGLAPTNDVYVTKFTALEDPLSSSGHIVRYRIGKNTTGGAQIDFTVELRQGYTNEGSQGTLIKQWTHSNVDALTTQTQTLSAGEADSITDYADLYLRIVANQA